VQVQPVLGEHGLELSRLLLVQLGQDRAQARVRQRTVGPGQDIELCRTQANPVA
jgi:hypothetical protein